MIERGYIRALVVRSKTHYFLDGGTQRGVTYEELKEFESFLNKSLGRRTLPVHVVILPVERGELIPALIGGRGDVAVANLTITEERGRQVGFSDPTLRGVSEVVVTGPKAPRLVDLDSLAGKVIHARPSSSYWESLQVVNVDLRRRGLAPIELEPAAEYLEDEDLLELVNAGVLPMAVVDTHKAKFWAQVLSDIVVREDLAIRTGGDIAWAFRKESPQLAEVVNAFIKGHKKGTLFGNVVFKRYLSDLDWVVHPDSDRGDERFAETIGLFRTYGERFGFDSYLLAAVGYQESHLDQSKRSRAGAVGVMQIKPSTAADPNVGVSDIDVLENNIHAGAKYLAFIRDRYFSGPELDPFDRVMFTLAAYNAGPARIRKLRAEAAESGLDPNRWYQNVEVVAARRIGRETVRYVSNITKYWIAYEMEAGQAARAENG
jgi:membrane-bound lytic murein transglycosylase MltF